MKNQVLLIFVLEEIKKLCYTQHRYLRGTLRENNNQFFHKNIIYDTRNLEPRDFK